MTGNDTAYLLYLTLFGLLIGGSYLIANRNRMGQVFQHAAIWFFIFVGAVLVIGNWDSIERAALPRQSVETSEQGVFIDVPRSRDGHYYMTLDVNGEPVDFVVDTGATEIVLSRADAAKIGIDPDGLRYLGQALTANGSVQTAQVVLDEVRLGDITDRRVRAIVNDGDLRTSLLGMSYLGSFGRIEIEDGRLRLTR
ncbi:retropepsin-like aspartic protease family protein [Jannaschia rubra]|uniref:Clan AA aspartic protease n=1 Tax=Jannaschia rubra TaxID=282197 RepID=A0A0M6XMK9_9RHOB|nr:TIGR02281 family clan AA aspartic protease [Jannaschia rubra]CTQ32420.1 clan AA aspartic protease [Jannaschia rubra]SFG44724.1 aspartyl protease family protein [Jannaschia rubra]